MILMVGVLAAVAAEKGGGNSYPNSSYAWDYQPGNRQWCCRDSANGQYANLRTATVLLRSTTGPKNRLCNSHPNDLSLHEER